MFILKYLKMVQTLYYSGSLSSAAVKLHQTQSALSHQCNTLEKYLGFRIFLRKSNPLKFTNEGNVILQLANQILPKVQKALENCYKIQKNTLRIVFEKYHYIPWLIIVLENFYQKYPNIKLEIININSNLKSSLKNRDLDLIFTSDFLKDCEICSLPVFDFEMCLILSPNHPLSKNHFISFENLINEVIISFPIKNPKLNIWNNFFKKVGIKPNLKIVNDIYLLIQMVSINMGISILPYWIVQNFEKTGYIVTRSFLGGIWKRLYAVIRYDEKKYPLIQYFISSLCNKKIQSQHIKNIF